MGVAKAKNRLERLNFKDSMPDRPRHSVTAFVISSRATLMAENIGVPS